MADAINGPKIISRKAAIAAGLKHYCTGVPCKRGHSGLRLVSTASCVVCARKATAEWRLSNLERSRKLDRSYRIKNPEKYRAKDRKAYAKNPDKRREKSRDWYRRNQEYAKRCARERHKLGGEEYKRKTRERAAAYRLKNPDRAKAAINNWWAKNPDKKKTYHRNRKARKRGNGGSHTAEDVANLFVLQNGKCAYCKINFSQANRHVDHIVPLARGGSNDRKNLQLLCEPCNLWKGSRDPIDAMRAKGMLL